VADICVLSRDILLLTWRGIISDFRATGRVSAKVWHRESDDIFQIILVFGQSSRRISRVQARQIS